MSNKMKKTNGNSIRLKGYRAERDFVKTCEEAGLYANRQPMSGILPGFKNDCLLAGKLSVEIKSRQKFSDYPLMELADSNTDRKRGFIPALVKKGDRKPFLVELYLTDFLEILKKVNRYVDG